MRSWSSAASRRIFWTQFFGSFNSNLLKNALIVLITYHTARFAAEGSVFAGMEPGVLVNLAAGLFIVPFILFSASAGQIADKYDKATLIRLIKGCEIAIMALAAVGLRHRQPRRCCSPRCSSPAPQSAFFGPVKYSILPQTLRETELVGGNALVETGHLRLHPRRHARRRLPGFAGRDRTRRRRARRGRPARSPASPSAA